MSTIPATPVFDIGDVVTYRDYQGRFTVGEVLWIEARWGYGSDREPLIVYTLHHPTYRNNRAYSTLKDIIGLVTP